ncbi:MAG: DUF1211 domain-containing protein [Bacteroidetes bacterium]|nr:DUF1211 domain-containing protein [Bacteroidota bacterium]
MAYNQIAGKDITRIIAISDGVFGVALTLLVLDIRVPLSEAIHSEANLMDEFFLLKEKFLIYLLAFMTGGIFWNGHVAQFKHIERSDRNLSWINLLFLLMVTLLPFSTAFLGDFLEYKFSIFVYWLNIFFMGFFLYLSWNYAYRKKMVNPETAAIINQAMRKRIFSAQALYFLGALLCFFHPILSVSFIILVQVNYAFGLVENFKLKTK